MQIKTDKENQLASENMRLVSSLCMRFVGKGIDYDDLFGAGCLGLCKAAKGFDESRGLMFSTYAVPVILGEIKRLFRDGGEVKVSRSIRELYLKANAVKAKLENTLSREVTVSEIAEEMNECIEDITEAFCACKIPVSLTAESEDGEAQSDIKDSFSDESLTEKINIKTAIERLDEKEQKLIKLRYYAALTQNETAKRLSMSQVQVSRAEKTALAKLRRILSSA